MSKLHVIEIHDNHSAIGAREPLGGTFRELLN